MTIRKFKPRKKPNYYLISGGVLVAVLLLTINDNLFCLTVFVIGFFIGKSTNKK